MKTFETNCIIVPNISQEEIDWFLNIDGVDMYLTKNGDTVCIPIQEVNVSFLQRLQMFFNCYNLSKAQYLIVKLI